MKWVLGVALPALVCLRALLPLLLSACWAMQRGGARCATSLAEAIAEFCHSCLKALHPCLPLTCAPSHSCPQMLPDEPRHLFSSVALGNNGK